MTFLYQVRLNEKYRKSENRTQDANVVIGQHFRFLKNLYGQGIVTFVGMTGLSTEDTNNTGIAIFTTPVFSAPEQLMQQDPAVSLG